MESLAYVALLTGADIQLVVLCHLVPGEFVVAANNTVFVLRFLFLWEIVKTIHKFAFDIVTERLSAKGGRTETALLHRVEVELATLIVNIRLVVACHESETNGLE